MSKGSVKRGQLQMVFRTHGGKRPGAGRKPKGVRPGEPHEARPKHDRRHPVHVTIRVVGNVAGLRRGDLYMALREATIVTARREDFRIVHMSIQRDHIHLLVEADHKDALSKGVRGFSISAARQINKAITARGGDRRTGKVISDRFHARPLTSPRAVRNTLAYILNNWRHHGEDQFGLARSDVVSQREPAVVVRTRPGAVEGSPRARPEIWINREPDARPDHYLWQHTDYRECGQLQLHSHRMGGGAGGDCASGQVCRSSADCLSNICSMGNVCQ